LTDCVDGKTPIEALTLGDITAAIYKGTTRSAITLTASGGDNNFTHIADGYWKLSLTAANVNTLGQLKITLRDDDVFLPVSEVYEVLPVNVFDSLFGTDKLQVDITQINGENTNGNNATLKLKQLDIRNAESTAIIAKCTGANGHGMDLAGYGGGAGLNAKGGNNSGSGIKAEGGSSGDGFEALSGYVAGSGIRGVALSSSGHGMILTSIGGSSKDLNAKEITGIQTQTDKIVDGGATADNVAAIGTKITDELTESDEYIDKTATPWQIVMYKKGDTETEYARKNLKDINGNDITSESQVIGKIEEPG